MERNVLKMIDVTQYMLFESSGDSDLNSDLNTPSARNSFSTFDRGFNHGKFDRTDHDGGGGGGDDDDDDAESCSYDSSYGECLDGFVNKLDGNYDYNYCDNYSHFRRSQEEDDDEMEEEGDAIESKLMVEEELPKKKKKIDLCTDFVMGRRQNKRSKDYCSSMDQFLNNQKETDKNFWDTCLAS